MDRRGPHFELVIVAVGAPLQFIGREVAVRRRELVRVAVLAAFGVENPNLKVFARECH